MPTDDHILLMENITKRFPGVLALDDVKFDLKRGEVHVLLGENGAGKSTLMKILSGAYEKDDGTIWIDGEQREISSPRYAQELGIGIIYQEFNLNPFLSVAENIFLGREPTLAPGVINWKRLFAKAQEILDELNVNINSKEEVGDLGVAMQQMVEVAKALSLNARILIMDEPTAALSRHEIQQLFRIIRHLKKQGVAVIYISHRLEEIFEIGDRVTVLRDGKYIDTRPVKSISRDELVRLMVNRDLDEQIPKKKAKLGPVVLRVDNLCVDNRLHDIEFSLRKGEVLGIAGLMGAGRTQLARAIFGVDKISEGKIYVDGTEVSVSSPRDAINAGIGFVTEDRKSEGLVLNRSVKENISLPNIRKFLSMGVLDFEKENRTVDEYISKLDIRTPGRDQNVVYLSGGNQQKVVLSKWLCSHARIFIFDEPTRGIDVGAKKEIYQLMNELTAKGVAIIMISSEMPEILGMSDRILVMCNGRITGRLDGEEATQEKIMKYALGELNEAV
ncbi:sugar ABC transporter ATP-binding protein [Aliifodinibius sp. S!AR15-10]|uniref:sugar ABC transporter ATP-binding protein n=1 Tax=Aliifodinibius sp. S!AR15-10 TaxID=2950437 RepID=UPI002861F9A7|nr:ATP-binding cassette domain-containing protein [Aliifodinibius sp. S!AR15-10]MDR8391727.1 sugar ABC transporter ATP-binding protein [Aliifodinibius sp. S!AR15-10]